VKSHPRDQQAEADEGLAPRPPQPYEKSRNVDDGERYTYEYHRVKIVTA
jgi:hypothetical protein